MLFDELSDVAVMPVSCLCITCFSCLAPVTSSEYATEEEHRVLRQFVSNSTARLCDCSSSEDKVCDSPVVRAHLWSAPPVCRSTETIVKLHARPIPTYNNAKLFHLCFPSPTFGIYPFISHHLFECFLSPSFPLLTLPGI